MNTTNEQGRTKNLLASIVRRHLRRAAAGPIGRLIAEEQKKLTIPASGSGSDGGLEDRLVNRLYQRFFLGHQPTVEGRVLFGWRRWLA